MQSEEIKKLLEENPHSISLQLVYADMLMKEKSYNKARTELESILKKDEFSPKAYFMLGEIASQGTTTLKYYEKALDIDSSDKDTLWAACNVLRGLINLKSARRWMTENITKAKKFSSRLLKISKNNEKPEIYKYMAFIARKERDDKKAIQYLEKAVKIFPDDPEIYIEMSILFREIRLYDYALKTAIRAISLDPESWEGYYDVGLALIFMGRYAEAAENFKKAIEKKPSYHLSYSQLGKCYLSLGKYNEAEEYYQKALEIFPNNRLALFGITYSYLDSGKYNQAIENFKILYKRKYFDKSEFIIKTAVSTLRDRAYLNMETLPNIANYFKLAETETGQQYADQLETFYNLSKDPETETKTTGWDDRVIAFIDTYKKFLQLSLKENLETRRKAYAAVQNLLKNAGTSLPILHFLSNHWSSVENYLDKRYGISPDLILNFKIKSNLLVNQIVKFDVSVINQGVHVANKVSLILQKSEKFSIDKYDYKFEKIENQKTFSVEFEPLEEGPLQLTAAAEVENYGSFKSTYDFIAFRRNPYFYGRPVHSPEMFFGRTELREKIIARLTNVVKQDIILTGIRRIGKTSFLYQLKNALKPPFFPILFSLQQVGNVEDDIAILRQLFLEILDGLERQEPKLGFTLRTIDKPILENFESKEFDIIARNFRISYENLISKLMKIEPGIRIVVLMDEGDYLFKVHARCQNFFRDLLQKYDRFVLVLAGSPIIRELSGHDFSSPFFNIFARYDIKGLEKEEVLDLINKPMEAADMQVEEASQESIYKSCGGHPHFLQAICYYLVEGMYKKKKKIIGVEELDTAKQKVIDELRESFKGIWNELNSEEKVFLNRLANESIPIIKARRLLSVERIEHLIQFELVNKSDSELSIYSDLIKQWTLEKLI